jgi:uncharacterized tellurite resistance protein B-like protein
MPGRSYTGGPMAFQALIRKLREGFCSSEASAPRKEEGLRVATAALLLEVARADESISLPEEKNLQSYLEETFQLDPAGSKQLMDAAEEVRRGTIDHWALAQFLRENTTLEQRLAIVRTMWRIVFSDGMLHEYENYLVRKIADLLGVEHRLMIEAKLAEMQPERL